MASGALVNREVFQLNNVQDGLRPGTISFKTVTMESAKYVCVRDVQPDGNTSLAVADIARRESSRHNIKEAEAALMNPNTKILALRQGQSMQLFNLDLLQRLKDTTMSEPVHFWKWVNPTTIGIITASAVYHWSTDATSNPVRVFDRSPELDPNEVQILSYRVDEQQKWHMINGIRLNAETGAREGKTQLYSVENGASRVIDGHAGCFTSMATPKDPSRSANIMSLAWHTPQGGRLLLMELPSAAKPDATFDRRNIALPISNAGDFPVACHVSPRHKLLLVVTSRGMAILVDPFTGTVVVAEQITQNVIFTGTPYEPTGGLLCVHNQGSVFHISIDDNAIAKYINGTLHNPELALRVASDAGLSGVDSLFHSQLNNLLSQGDVLGAIEVCRTAPNSILRTQETLQKFSALPQQAGQSPAISTYFKTLLQTTTLNAIESVELAKVVLQKQAGAGYIKEQFKEEKLEPSEQLGDLMAPHDQETAMEMYHKIKAHHKVVNVLLSRNDTQKAVAYCKKFDYSPDWRVVLQNVVRNNANDAVNLALMLHNDMGSSPVIDPNDVVDMFLPGQHIREASLFLHDILKNRNTPETAALQTRLLEINLKHSTPEIAAKFFAANVCSFYDPLVIAPLCERAGLVQQALEGYNRVQLENKETSMLSNIKRCLAQGATSVSLEWLLEFFGRLPRENCLPCLRELMKNAKQNYKVIVQIAIKYNDALGSDLLINLFLESRAWDILYYYLGAVVAYSRDAEMHFRYIEAATEVGQISEVERMTRESPCYEPERTKNYLKEKKLDDLWPFINVCDKHDFIDEMVKYLLDTNQNSFIEQYVQRRNPQNTPRVVGVLLEFDVSESIVKNIIGAAGSMCPLDELIAAVEARGRLRMLRPWLEARAAERKPDPALHNALAKIYVDTYDNAESFLKQNEHYDPALIGEYCVSRDPNLALIAYQRGNCHEEIIAVCVKNALWKYLAKHLVKQQSLEMWSEVLENESVDKQSFVECVRHEVAETSVADEVISTVRAFMKASLTHELTTILDQVVINGQFQKNRYLENLLLISAINARPEKVMEYLNKLSGYEPNDIGPAAVKQGLYDAAFTVYNKADMKADAVRVLLENLDDVPRARSYAVESSLPAVWTELGKHLLRKEEIHEAIEALIHAKNADFVADVVEAADKVNQYSDLIRYLKMAREVNLSKDPKIDTYLVLTYAKTGALSALEDFLKDTSHGVQVIQVADKCFNDELYDSARVLYQAASNFPKLALTLLRLKNFSGAVDAAHHAQNAKTWKEVLIACIEAKELDLAQQCGVQVVIHPELLGETVALYEDAGLFDELINVVRSSLGQQGAHMSLYTELAILYAKYKPDSLLEHVRMFPKKINTSKIINVCREYRHWIVVRHLHINNEEWLAGAQTMMEHPAECWDHSVFKDVVLKLGSSDICYTAIAFYIAHCPDKLHDFLIAIQAKLDSERVMNEVKRHAPLTTIKKFLEATQDRDVRKVNDALNEMYVDEEDFVALRKSVDLYKSFDSAELSAKLEKMEMFEFRRIALMLHRRNKRYFHAIEVAKANGLFTEAIESAAESKDKDLVEKLLLWFVESGKQDCFSACLFMCYDFIQMHTVLELAWQHGMLDAAMPFIIQNVQELNEKVAALDKQMSDAQKQAKEAQQHAHVGQNAPLMIQNQNQQGGGARGPF